MEQFWLQLKGKFADFIKEERPMVGHLKTAKALRYRTRERAFFMAKKLAFQNPRRNRGAIQFYERISPPWT